jgi:hypothetical protein
MSIQLSDVEDTEEYTVNKITYQKDIRVTRSISKPTELFKAIHNDDEEQVKKLLDQGCRKTRCEVSHNESVCTYKISKGKRKLEDKQGMHLVAVTIEHWSPQEFAQETCASSAIIDMLEDTDVE